MVSFRLDFFWVQNFLGKHFCVPYTITDNFWSQEVEGKEVKELFHKATGKQKPPGRNRRHHQRSQCNHLIRCPFFISASLLNNQIILNYCAAMGVPSTNKHIPEKEQAENKRFGPAAEFSIYCLSEMCRKIWTIPFILFLPGAVREGNQQGSCHRRVNLRRTCSR